MLWLVHKYIYNMHINAISFDLFSFSALIMQYNAFFVGLKSHLISWLR